MAALGTDFAGGIELDWALRPAFTPRHALTDAITRRLTTDAGSLEDFPEYGYNVRNLIGSIARKSAIEQNVLAQCMAEEEVLDATVNVAQNDSTLSISVELTDGNGPFSLVFNVTKLGVSVIFPN